MLEHLFGSRTRVKLLRIFFADPQQRFFVRELTRLLDIQINAVRRELAHLTNTGIVIAIADDAPPEPTDDPHEGKRKYYKLNESSVLYPELKALLLKSNVLGEQALAAALTANKDVDLLLFTGIFTNTTAPIDMLLVGSISERNVAKIVHEFEHEHGSSLRYTVLSLREYQERRQLMDRFLYSILDTPHQIVVDTTKSV